MCSTCMKVENVINGWKNVIFKDPIVEELAKNRMVFCEGCIENKTIVKVAGVKHGRCAKCNCPLVAKVRSINEKCPIGKW